MMMMRMRMELGIAHAFLRVFAHTPVYLLLAACSLLPEVAPAAPSAPVPLLEPTLMGPPFLAEEMGKEDYLVGDWPWQRTPLFLGRETSAVTCVTWLLMERSLKGAYAQPMPSWTPREALSGKAPCETFLGPVRGTGPKTWPAGVPAKPSASGIGNCAIVAYNLTCSGAATLTFDDGYNVVTNAPGAHLGVLAYAEAGCDIRLETPGDWELEVAWPKEVACYFGAWSATSSQDIYNPVILADQWGCVFAEFDVAADGTVGCVYRTYYPDGCSVTNDFGSVVFTANRSARGVGRTGFKPGDLFGAFGVARFIWTQPAKDGVRGTSYTAFGPKLWPRALTESERRQIVAKDAAVMLKRGLLTPADLHPGAHTALRSAPTHTHFPGNMPQPPTEPISPAAAEKGTR